MWKKVLVGAAALALVGSTIVYAQHRHFGPPHGFAFNAEDMPALLDARMAALKAGLTLSPDQEKNWPAFEQAYRDLAKQRMDRITARDGQTPANPLERLQRQADRLSQRGAALKKLADATAPLFNSFDEGQKRRFHILAHPMGPRFAHFAWNDRHDGDFRGPRGFEHGPGGPEQRQRGFDRSERSHGPMPMEKLQWVDPKDNEDL